MTHEMQHMSHRGLLALFQNFRSLGLMVWDIRSYEDISTNHELIYESIYDKSVCRTAPATPGLLKYIYKYIFDM